ncbi:MAG: carbamoyltransferase C-terminal domain-containing protein [Alphaproteobacteria bacterium]|nr:carbamoyltransferase C-terminal domain-containing protein [Alphaproteobacteria bacterium]
MNDLIHILGIHDGHNSGATLARNGEVIASVSEERLTRRKNEVGYPEKAIEEVLRIGGIDAAELDEVVYASLFMHARQYLTDLEPWYKVGLTDQRAAAQQPESYRRVIFEERKRERIEQVCRHLDVPEDRITFVEHHLAHLAAAYYTSPQRQPSQPVLGLTCDGAGDGLCATVSICRDNEIERVAATDRHASLGKIYSRATFLMGMTPWEHEYKLMGLAPYADPERAGRAAEPLRKLLKLREDGLGFAQAGVLSTNYCYEYLRTSFERVRFDTIAGAVQRFTEEMLVGWVKACVAHTGIRDLVCGGGVFMNVKANMLIAQLPEVRSLYVMPSAADESLSIGAALHRFYQRSGVTDHRQSVLENLYLGGEFSPSEEEDAVKTQFGGDAVSVAQPNDMNRAIAELLAKGEIVASCRGRMEWGARALGNRSILAGAEDYRRVDRINQMIKKRDFWMPFAPSIRAESAERYFEDPKDLKPWFMTLAFPGRDDGYPDLAAGSHPRDRTIRPQIVTREANPDYHEVISHFDEATGRGVVLNTSFNLHGEPIVYTPSDAVRVFAQSGLDHLALGSLLVSKKKEDRF